VYVAVKDLEAIERLVLKAEQSAGIHGFHWANPIVLDKALSEALQHLLAERHISQILVDGDKPKTYTRQLKKVLRDKGITVRKIRSVKDEAYPMIRIADAVAGAARATYDDPRGKAAPLLRLLESKIELRIDL